MAALPQISMIVPTRNRATRLPQFFEALCRIQSALNAAECLEELRQPSRPVPRRNDHRNLRKGCHCSYKIRCSLNFRILLCDRTTLEELTQKNSHSRQRYGYKLIA